MPCPYERFDQVTKDYPDELALICTHQRPGLYGLGPTETGNDYHGKWTYRQLREGVARLSVSLEQLGLAEGCLLFIVLGNSIEHVLATFAGYRLGCIHVSIHPQGLSNPTEAKHIVQTVLDNKPSLRAAFLVKDRETAGQFDQLFPNLDCTKIIVEEHRDSWVSFVHLMNPEVDEKSSTSTSKPPRATSPETSIFFTSGTTSLPKACIMDVPAWITSLGSRSTFGSFAPGNRVLVLVPCSHVLGYMGQMFALTHGATLIYTSYFAFQPQATMEILHRERCTHIVMVSALAHAFITANSSARRRIQPLDTVIFSGMTLSADILKEFQETVRTLAIENLYGMTEGAFCSTGRVEDIKTIVRDGFVAAGLPMLGSRVRICAPGSRSPLPCGVAGEVHHSGYQTARAYIGVDSEAFYVDEEGCPWYITGDQAAIYEDGLLYPIGRYKELIIRGGKNISPAAIEAVLNRDSELQLLNPQVVPLPDPVAGEVPVIVVNKDLRDDQGRRIIKVILSQMGPTYAPNKIISIQSLGKDAYPRTTSGKVQKMKLAALVRKHEEDQLAERHRNVSLDDLAWHHRVVHIWAETLGTKNTDLDLHAKLSERLDSITSMRVHAKIRRVTGKDVPFATWATVDSIADQLNLLESASDVAEINEFSGSTHSRMGGPSVEDMVHLISDPSQLQATHDIIRQTIASCQLSWDDIEDIFPATDFHDIMCQTHLIDSWEFFVSVQTQGADTQVRKHLTMNEVHG